MIRARLSHAHRQKPAPGEYEITHEPGPGGTVYYMRDRSTKKVVASWFIEHPPKAAGEEGN